MWLFQLPETKKREANNCKWIIKSFPSARKTFKSVKILKHYDRRKMEARWEVQEIHDNRKQVLEVMHIPCAGRNKNQFPFQKQKFWRSGRNPHRLELPTIIII